MSQNTAANMLELVHPAAVVRFPANPVGRDLIVGDVHGCFTKLAAALRDVGFDPDRDRLFALGDLVDRGPESEAALDWLAQPWFFAIRGNHEDMACRFVVGDCPPPLYLANGGAWLIGTPEDARLTVAYALACLPLVIELETAAGLLGLVHADCPRSDWAEFSALMAGPDSVERQSAEASALWSRDRSDRLFDGPVAGVRAVLVGHTPVERVTALGNVVFCDTGAWLEQGATPRPFVILDAATLAPAVAPAPVPPAHHPV